MSIIIGNGNDDILAGGSADDILRGEGGTDVLRGFGGADLLDGGDGFDTADYSASDGAVSIDRVNDTAVGGHAEGDTFVSVENFQGSAHGDRITGDDRGNGIFGGAGADIISGGGGNDVLRGDAGADLISGGEGIDLVSYSTSTAGVSVNLLNGSAGGGHAAGDVLSGIEMLRGSSFADSLSGDNSNNVLEGSDGDDFLSGNGGNDTLVGGGGLDTLLGGDQDDLLVGGAGGDFLDGGSGFDTVDFSTSGGVLITLAGGLGSGKGGDAEGDFSIERVLGSAFADVLEGAEIEEQFFGGLGIDAIFGGGGADHLDGGGDDDAIFGGDGNDVLVGGAAADVIDGGGGTDTADYSASSAAVAISLALNDAFGGDAEGDTLVGIERVTGSAFSDDIEGDALANTLSGGAGRDLLKGGGGGDTLDGGGGTDNLVGGEGNDLYLVTATDNIIEKAGEGTADRVAAQESFELGGDDNIEVLSTTNTTLTTAINLTGNALKQEIIGNAGSNILHTGGGAADVMKGLGGNDTYRVFNTGDVIVERLGEGIADKVMAAVDYKLGAGVRIEILQTNGSSGTAAIDLTGNEIGQQIAGNVGANRLEGKGGNDTLRGGGGADTFVFATKLGGGNVDQILDFSVPADRLLLSDAIFTALDTGTLSAAAFRANTTGLAQDSSDRIIYETDTGKLFYDADGAGGSAGIQFATLTVGLALTNADFSVA